MQEADCYRLDDLLTPAEREVRDRVRRFADREVVPVINDHWERGEFPAALVPRLAELRVAGGTIRGYGCPGMSAVAAGLVQLELARGDSSLSTFFGVHSGLAMTTIAACGSEEQRRRWLPAMASIDLIGAFALTEPLHGSDVARLETSARRTPGGYVLNGTKRWIGNASFADLTIVWARCEDGQVGGFVVPRASAGFEPRVIERKASKRAVLNAHVELRDVEVPEENRLPGARSFRDVAAILRNQRFVVAWEALGDAIAGYEAALGHVRTRRQFGKPLAAHQLVQHRLAWMLAEITAMQLICHRLSQLTDAGQVTDGMAALAKMHNASRARRILAEARDLLGGDGILLDHHVARHLADVEAVVTYDGTESIQALILGREITGLSAFG